MSVIEHDFGGRRRRADKRFRELLTLDALHEANLRANPLPYLERASERIYQLERTLFEAAQAAKPEYGEAPSTETIAINKAEYQRLHRCLAIIEKGLAQLGSATDLFAGDGEHK
ncbi:MAG: hypothetical protein J2P53_18250 [Bradyrhizobiaceae bacterium]|nr:hypothetical protein [Bradyrhizobiaceae bacterium]